MVSVPRRRFRDGRFAPKCDTCDKETAIYGLPQGNPSDPCPECGYGLEPEDHP